MADYEATKKLKKTTDTLTNFRYYENRIKQSGDVQPNPGPVPVIQKNKVKVKSNTNLHLLQTITTLILIINVIHNWDTTRTQATKYNSKECCIINCKIASSNITKSQRKLYVISKRSATHLCILLILLSGDVHANPGPNGKILCSKCKKEVTCNSSALKCETCLKFCHTKCEDLAKTKPCISEDRNYSWICPNQQCIPNFSQPVSPSQINLQECSASPNRFNILSTLQEQPNTHKSKISTPIRGKKANYINTDTSHRQKGRTLQRTSCKQGKTVRQMIHHKETKLTNALNIWDELTKISPTEYEGKELCKACHKNIGKSQKAISCDLCERWTHQKCSDMKDKTYIVNKKKKRFPWICNTCRIDESNTYEEPDVKVLTPKEMPETLETVREKTQKDMLIIHMNSRSILNKTDELQHICKTLQPDIVCITETWLDDSVPTQTCTPNGYNIIRKDRSEDFKQKYGRNKGGGVAVYYKEHLNVERKEYLTDKCEEILWVQIKLKTSYMLGVIYQAEYTHLTNEYNGESKIEENIRRATEITDRVIITGDYNIDTSSQNKESQHLKNIYKCYGLTQHITKPTRVDSKSRKPATIDHIWSNKEINLVKKTGTFMGLSDHFGIYMTLNVQQQQPKKDVVKYRCFKTYNSADFNEDLNIKLGNSNVHRLIQANDVNQATEELIKIIQDTANVHAPVKEIQIGKRKNAAKWSTDELAEKIEEKNELLTDYFGSGLSFLKVRANKLKNEINHLKRKLKKSYFTEKINEVNGDSKKLWKILKEITGTRKNKNTIEPEMLTQEKANKYNTFFATVGAEIQKHLKVQPHSTDYSGLKGFEFKDECEGNITKLIDKIKPDVAVGDDTINARLIKDAKATIVPILTQIINIGYKRAIFPDIMKNTIIKAIHKKNCTDDIANYRPLSILPTLSKIFERAAANQIIAYLENNNKINRNQHAYRSKHSTITCLVEVLDHIYKLFDQKRCSAIVSLDLSKAFDSISHTLLLHKLTKLGVGEGILKWTKSYLMNRKQRTKFKSFISKEETIVSGIPQGSIIGPLLFICFTNDLADEFKDCKMVAYADDTQLIVLMQKPYTS
jgi:endonuclease/exonuclease/phosphatase (EEP) superfamily protein YafD